jgi:hypothetical protein
VDGASDTQKDVRRVNVVRCAECESPNSFRWRGWRAYRTDFVELGEPPALSFYCPTCAQEEFD